MEFDFKMLMSHPEPDLLHHLFTRIRMLHIAMTTFKADELLKELPSKRLLLKYIMHNTDETLKEELTKHFKFKEHQSKIIRLFRNLVNTDFETGILIAHAESIQSVVEYGINKLAADEINTFLVNFNSTIEMR